MLHIENRDGIAIIHMRHRPVNRLGPELLRRLTAAFEFVRSSSAVVLIGHGDVFAIGSDHGDTEAWLVAERAAMRAVSQHPGPVVAAVNGAALNAGFALALAADARVGANATMGLTRPVIESTTLTAESCEIISLAAGPFAESMLSAPEPFTTDEALALGLLDQVSTPLGLLDDALAHAKQLAGRHSVVHTDRGR